MSIIFRKKVSRDARGSIASELIYTRGGEVGLAARTSLASTGSCFTTNVKFTSTVLTIKIGSRSDQPV